MVVAKRLRKETGVLLLTKKIVMLILSSLLLTVSKRLTVRLDVVTAVILGGVLRTLHRLHASKVKAILGGETLRVI